MEFSGYDAEGKSITLSVPDGGDAISAQEAVLRAGGRLLDASWARTEKPYPRGIDAKSFARFNEMLAASVRRGVPMLEGVRQLARNFRNKKFRRALKRVEEALARGEPPKDAFDAERAHFPRFYGAILEAGVAADSLPTVLLRLCRNIRADVAFRQTIVQALLYPMFLVVIGAGVVSGFVYQILPRYAVIAEGVSVKLPWLLRATPGNPPGMRLMTLLSVMLIFTTLLWSAIVRNGVGRVVTENLARHIPVFKDFYEAASWSAFADTMALLLKANVPLPLALRLAGLTTGADWLARCSRKLAEDVECGRKLSDAASKERRIPRRVLHAIESGERTGDLASALEQLAERYRSASERRAAGIIRSLPPILSVIFGVFVLYVAFSVLEPMVRFMGGAW